MSRTDGRLEVVPNEVIVLFVCMLPAEVGRGLEEAKESVGNGLEIPAASILRESSSSEMRGDFGMSKHSK